MEGLCEAASSEDGAGSSDARTARLPAPPVPRVSWGQLEGLHHIGSGEFCDVWAAQLRGAQLTTTLGATLGATQQCSVPVAVKARAATHTR